MFQLHISIRKYLYGEARCILMIIFVFFLFSSMGSFHGAWRVFSQHEEEEPAVSEELLSRKEFEDLSSRIFKDVAIQRRWLGHRRFVKKTSVEFLGIYLFLFLVGIKIRAS